MPLLKRLKNCICPFVFVFAVSMLLGCATRPAVQTDDFLFSLLPHDDLVYLRFPVEENKELAFALVHSAYSEMPRKNVERIVKRLGTVYFSMLSDDFCVCADGSFPNFALGFVLTKKNGWSKVKSKDIPVTGKYYEHKKSDLQLAFPSSSVAVAGKSVFPMLSSYADYEAKPSETKAGLFFQCIERENPDTVSFYITNLSALLPSFKIANLKLEFPFSDAWGCLYEEKKSKDVVYQLDATLTLSDSRVVRAAVAALRIASRTLNLPFVVDQKSDSSIRIHGLYICPDSLGKFISRIFNNYAEE